jgi:hypothetical protein
LLLSNGFALNYDEPCAVNPEQLARAQTLSNALDHRRIGQKTNCLRCSGWLHFAPVVLLKIAQSQQLMLDENSVRNRNSLREYVQDKGDELLTIIAQGNSLLTRSAAIRFAHLEKSLNRSVLTDNGAILKTIGIFACAELGRTSLIPRRLPASGALCDKGHNEQHLANHLEKIEGLPLHFTVRGNPSRKFMPYWQVSDEEFTCYTAVSSSA